MACRLSNSSTQPLIAWSIRMSNMFKTMKESMAKTPPTICKQQTSQLSLFGSVTHYFACNLTTGISSWKYYIYGVSLPIYVQLVIHILYCAYGNLTTWWVNLTTKNISLTIYVDFRLRGLHQEQTKWERST